MHRDLAAAAAPGGPEIAQAGELLAGSLDASMRMCLLEAISDAAAELTTKLGTATVDVRLRGRQADLVVTEVPAGPPPGPSAAPAEPGDLARITLRLPEPLKEQVERIAAAEGTSVNSWLVRAISAAVYQGHGPTSPPRGGIRPGRQISGFAQA
jgi:hypothetical protein